MITGSWQMFFKKYHLGVGGDNPVVKSYCEDLNLDPHTHVRAGSGGTHL